MSGYANAATFGTTSPDYVSDFESEMRAAGIDLDEPINPNGAFRRYHVRGDASGRRNAWAVYFPHDHPAGAFGCNKRHPGQKFTWSAKGSTQSFTPAERAAFKAKIDAERKLRA